MSNETAGFKVPNGAIKRRGLIIAAIVFFLIVGGALFWYLSLGKESTDDAQVDGHVVPVSPRVSGHVGEIFVDDNQHVHAHQLLVLIDQRDLRAKLNSALANLASARDAAAAAGAQLSLVERTAPATKGQAGAAVGAAQAAVATAQDQIASAEAQYAAAKAAVAAAQSGVTSAHTDVESSSSAVQSAEASLLAAQADVTSAEAQAEKTASDAERYRDMYKSGAVSKQALDYAEAANTSAQAALSVAKDRISVATSALKQAKSHLAGTHAAAKQASARLAAAVAAASQAKAGIATSRSASIQAEAQLEQARSAEAGASVVPQQLGISTAQQKGALAKVKQEIANVRTAELNLSYTQIRSSVDGVVSQKNVEPGQYVEPGQLLLSVVPLRNVWVVANFKETQIEKMHHGDRAVVAVDTYPGQRFEGRVQSIAGGTGALFSLLPPENATGNFVKVVQRVPVKIVFDKPLPKGVVLRPGLNVIATVYTR